MKWIRGRPQAEGHYIIYSSNPEDGGVCFVGLEGNCFDRLHMGDVCCCRSWPIKAESITHWQPLPPAPEEKE